MNDSPNPTKTIAPFPLKLTADFLLGECFKHVAKHHKSFPQRSAVWGEYEVIVQLKRREKT